MNRLYNKGAIPKTMNKVSQFEDHGGNFYSDKTVHFYNMGFLPKYSSIVNTQNNLAKTKE